MAFIEENLSVIGGESSEGPSIYSYLIPDGDDPKVNFYFDSKYDTLKVNDQIFLVSDSAEVTLVTVTSSGPAFSDGVDVALTSIQNGGGSGGGVQSVTGDGVDNTDPSNPVISYPDKADIGLGNVDNTSDLDKPVSNATQAAINAINPGGMGIYSAVAEFSGGTLSLDNTAVGRYYRFPNINADITIKLKDTAGSGEFAIGNVVDFWWQSEDGSGPYTVLIEGDTGAAVFFADGNVLSSADYTFSQIASRVRAIYLGSNQWDIQEFYI